LDSPDLRALCEAHLLSDDPLVRRLAEALDITLSELHQTRYGKPAPVAPDDTPTRLFQELAKNIDFICAGSAPKKHRLLILGELRAEVSRLREAQAKKQAESDYWRGKFNFADGALATAESDVSRLQQENALLRRSMEMLTKQMDEEFRRL
jgi:hypothetical protein